MIAIISLTKNGTILNQRLSESLKAVGYTLERYQLDTLKPFTNIHKIFEHVFKEYDGLVFIGAIGIAVRCISPYIETKLTDIPVVVCDELGQYCIPILSGHLGGANDLAYRIADITGGLPIITTATDINRKFSVDVWAKKNGLEILEPFKIKEVSSAILDGIPVGFYSDYPIKPPQGVTADNSCRLGIVISNYIDISPFENSLHLLPKNLILGIGCKRGTSMENIETLVMNTLNQLHMSILSVMSVHSIDLKSNEIGILDFCKKYDLKSYFFTADELNSQKGEYTTSKFVEEVTGVDCVCERAATYSNNVLIQKKLSDKGVTLAIAMHISIHSLFVKEEQK